MVSSGKAFKGEAKREKNTAMLDDIARMKRDELRRKQEQYLHQKLVQLKEQEEKYTTYNKAKLQIKWRSILRRTKTSELEREIEVLSQTHEREVDRKDALIAMMFRDIATFDEQYKLALRTHQRHVDELIALQEKRVDMMDTEFRNMLRQLVTQFRESISNIKVAHEDQMTEMKDILHEMNKREGKINEQLEYEFGVESKAILSKYSNLFHVMKIEMNDLYKTKHKQYKTESERTGKPITASYRKYEDLRNENDETDDEIKNQMLMIRKNEELLSQWKAKWLNNQREAQQRNRQLHLEIDVLKTHFNDVKRNMRQFRDAEFLKLKELVKHSKATSGKLTEHLDIAKAIIERHELTNKNETTLERKIISRLAATAEPLDNSESQSVVNNNAEESLPLAPKWQELGSYHTKLNKVVLDKMALVQEKEHLLMENQKLRSMLKNYLDGISVNEDVLNRANPLLIVEPIGNQSAPRQIRR